MKMRAGKKLFAAVLGLLLLPSFADASINITFEGDAIGSAPGVNPAPGNPMTQPSAIGGYDPNYASPPTPASGTILVGTPSGTSKEAVLTTNSSNNVLGALWLDVNGTNLTGQTLLMSFDVNVLSAPASADTQPKILNGGPGSAGILLGLNAFITSDQNPASVLGFGFAAAPTSDGGGVFAFRTPDNQGLTSFFNYTEGVQHNISILANYSSGTLSAYVDGALALSNYSFWAAGQTNVKTNELFFFLNGEEFASSVALDNIAADVVPEPMTIAVWSVLGLCGSAFAWRANRRQLTA